MTELEEALRRLGLDARVSRSGRWAVLQGERCRVYVIVDRGGGYGWCDCEGERVIRHYPDVDEAIRAGLRRAAHPRP